MQNTGNQNSQEEHADNDEGGDHEGDDVFLGGEEIKDRVPGGIGGWLVLQLQTGLHVDHLIIFRIQYREQYIMYILNYNSL